MIVPLPPALVVGAATFGVAALLAPSAIASVVCWAFGLPGAYVLRDAVGGAVAAAALWAAYVWAIARDVREAA